MKRVFMIVLGLLAMMTASLSAKAQDISVTLIPGWTWIGFPKTEAMDIADALGDFAPEEGDVIRSKYGMARYHNGVWRGNLQRLTPGLGYMYYNNRAEPINLVFVLTPPQSQVTVTTSEPMLITAVSAMGGGEVTTNDGSFVDILVRGICWGANPNPTLNDNSVEMEGGMGSFVVSMTDLNISTTYYVRAYAVTANGTIYGDEKIFTTRDGIPTLTTTGVSSVGYVSANSGGTVIDDGGLYVNVRGICWSSSPNPTVSDAHTTDGSGTGIFISNITGLIASTTYYVRAYAINSNNTFYGNEVSFTTLDIPEGAIDGMFSVSESQQVYFSQGNLQFQASTGIWRFAENQWDYVGTQTPDIDGHYGGTVSGSDNSNISSTYTGWIDLFGWGTSGYHNLSDPYNVYFQPWSNSISTINTDYNYYGYGPSTNMVSPNLTASSANYDWGVYNPISNGGNLPSQWRTLTRQEWIYLFDTRNTVSGIRFAKAIVNGVNGVILLPDNWTNSIYSLSYTNNGNANYTSNYLTALQWSILESAGAVFLPASGYRKNETSVDLAGSQGYYWSTTFFNMDRAFGRGFGGGGISMASQIRYRGYSVRLVCPVE